MMKILWVLEPVIFGDGHARLAAAAEAAGQEVWWWQDDWLQNPKSLPKKTWKEDTFTLFHGSLGCANEIYKTKKKEWGWTPGAFCNTDNFFCSAWYDKVKPWLVHDQWKQTTVQELVNDSGPILQEIGSSNQFFVRPDSPLKPFSGRVLTQDQLSLRALDHGFYYDDENLPIIVAPLQEIDGHEWRFVVAGDQLVASSSYSIQDLRRSETTDNVPEPVTAFASEIAKQLQPPLDPMYIMDICEVHNRNQQPQLRLMELNPFSGADLYNCDRAKIVQAVADLAAE